MNALVDNDILCKGSCYGILIRLISTVCEPNQVGILGSARYVVRKKIRKLVSGEVQVLALKIFAGFLRQATEIEPVEIEIQMAADLELAAQRLGISLDGGESQLCAVLCMRYLPLLLTGDKRAIVALEGLFDHDSRLLHLAGKLMCLEQLIVKLLQKGKNGDLDTTIRKHPTIDRSLMICFSGSTNLEGLQSYVNSLRSSAGRVLCE